MYKKKNKMLFMIFLFLVFYVAFIYLNRRPEVSCDYFEKNYLQMEQVVNMAKNNELKIIDKFVESTPGILVQELQLPFKFRHLSKGGKIFYRLHDGITAIIFVSGYDIMGEHPSGYLYKSDNQYPTSDFYLSLGIDIRIKECWFTSYH